MGNFASRMGAVVCLIVALSCESSSSMNAVSFVVRDSAGVRIAENGSFGAAPECLVSGPSVIIGDGTGRPEYELYRVFGARRLTDGSIVVVNQGSQELRFYDRSGTYVRSAGREGQGPGEFRSAFYLWVAAGDTLWVGDNRPWKFHVYSPEGQWLRTVRPEPTTPNSPALTAVLADGRMVLAPRPAGGPLDFHTRRETMAVVHESNGMVIDTLGVFDYGVWGRIGDAEPPLIIYPLFESAPWLDGFGDIVYAGHGSEAEVVQYSGRPDLAPVLKIRWDPGNLEVRPSHVAAERNRLEGEASDYDPVARRQYLDPLVSEERPVEEEFPRFNDLVINRAGGFWVREYPRPDSPTPHRWAAFAANGELTCRISLPPVEVLDIGEGYVLVEQQSDLGVEQVALYEVLRPTD